MSVRLLLGLVSMALLLACSGAPDGAAVGGPEAGGDRSVVDAVASSPSLVDATAETQPEVGDDAGASNEAATESSSGSESGPHPDNIQLDAGGAVTSILVSPDPLTPAFASAIHDYYVRCSAGTNAISLTVGTGDGSSTVAIDVVEDQAVVVGDYWIRCLPHDFPPITVKTNADAGAPTPGWYLLNSSVYAMALDTNGTPVWYTRGTSVVNVDALTPDTISFMPNATVPFGYGSTEYALHSLATGTIATVEAVGSATDVHELRLLPNGDHLLLTYPFKSGVDLTGLKTFGSAETIADCEIQEVDPAGNLVWSWRASDHIDPVLESLAPATNTVLGQSIVDVYHCNAIDVDSSGNLLLSSRHTSALFYIDRSSGEIVWKLGGSEYSKDGANYVQIVDDPETSFSLQHDARFLPNGDISLFDDHGAGSGVARGVEYALDLDTNVATVAWQFLGIAASLAEGSCRRYADGETVIAWGYNTMDPRVVTEVNAEGDDVLDISFTTSTSTYRAVKVPLSQLDANLLRSTVAQ
jgi:Arylsulfotransferase (ASST)